MYTLHTSIFLNLITKHQFRNVQSTPLDVQLHNSRIINESNSPSFHGGIPKEWSSYMFRCKDVCNMV